MPTWAWLLLLAGVVAVMLLADVMQQSANRTLRKVAEERAVVRRECELLRLARAYGIRFEVHLTEWPMGGWRWSVWDADAALYRARPVREGLTGVEDPYASGNAVTKADAEAQALAEIAGLRLQQQVDEVFVA